MNLKLHTHIYFMILCTWNVCIKLPIAHWKCAYTPKHKCTSSPKIPIAINQTKKKTNKQQHPNHTQATEEAPIDQPRRLSLRRPSFKREVIANESFIDIQLKPVTKDKATPQKAEQKESSLTKVTRYWVNILFSSVYLSGSRSHPLYIYCRSFFFLFWQESIRIEFLKALFFLLSF